MRDVEFVPGPSEESGGSEDLVGSGRRRIPPWLIVAVLVVLAAIVLVAILNRTGRPTAAPAATISEPGPGPATPQQPSTGVPYTFHVPLPPGVGQPFQTGLSAHVFDVATSSQSVWALTDRGLMQFLPDGSRSVLGFGGARLPPVATSGSARLVVDQQADLLWVVVDGTHGGHAIAYNLSHGVRIAETSTPPINGAAALGGLLYITSDRRVLSVSTAPAVHTVVVLPRPLGTVTADPSRGRLLVLDYAQRTHVWAIDTTTGGRAIVSAPTPVHIYPGGLIVAHGSIWIGGFDDGYGSLFRLGPNRLQVVPQSENRNRFPTGSIPVAAGDSVLWVRDAQGTELHCLDARTGRELQNWSIDGPVASQTGLAVVASRAGLVPLQLSACQG